MSAHVPDPRVRTRIDVDRALLERDDDLITVLDLPIVREATRPDGDAVHRLRSVPGIGTGLPRTSLSEIHDSARVDRVPACASSARRVQCTHTSAGTTRGPGGVKMGHGHVTSAFSEAAVRFLRHAPGAKKLLGTIEKTHGTGKALSMSAHPIGRAVCDRLARRTVFSMEQFRAGSRVPRSRRTRAPQSATSRRSWQE